MDKWKTLQISFAYIGTVVGAGFATGQEILQFFTQFGWIASWTIAAASLMFVVYGAKLMLCSKALAARSYEDLNIHLFGSKLGKAMSMVTLIILLAVTGVMLAGAGAIFEEQLQWSYQAGLGLTLALTFVVLKKGLEGILSINSLVVPLMMMFAVIVVISSIEQPLTQRWLSLESDHQLGIAWLAPFLYVAFNLWMAQAVLVPLGATIRHRRTIIWGSVWGGLGIGVLIWVAHFAMSPLIPGVQQFDIPMRSVIINHSWWIQGLFLLILFSEIFTTLVANIYGLTLQLQQRFRWRSSIISTMILLLCYALSQFGFKALLSVLYPLFGLLGLVWFVRLMFVRSARSSQSGATHTFSTTKKRHPRINR